ncbi:MAG: dihydroneopterin aldolase [Proteobacteria bacterium]|nr:dihydroneopterin aldolase [Pseudomonadota bacterium]
MNTSQIVIRDLPFYAFHGVYPHEHTIGTDFKADIVITLDNTLTCFKDDIIDHALNYETIVHDLLKIGTTTQFNLVERLAEAFAENILAHKEAIKADVTIHKYVKGITEQPLWIAIAISRSKSC